ncbi:hypothetical protein F5B17DRAFT_423123 [Nemania serpens]|nr:hypothetical protein F5B17DRAFT_423123 [Nemania serpens]
MIAFHSEEVYLLSAFAVLPSALSLLSLQISLHDQFFYVRSQLLKSLSRGFIAPVPLHVCHYVIRVTVLRTANW